MKQLIAMLALAGLTAAHAADPIKIANIVELSGAGATSGTTSVTW